MERVGSKVRVTLGLVDRRVPQKLTHLLETPRTTPPARYERRRARVPEIVPPPRPTTERLLPGPDGLVRIALERPFSDGTVAIDLDPLSLLCRLAATVPPSRFMLTASWYIARARQKA